MRLARTCILVVLVLGFGCRGAGDARGNTQSVRFSKVPLTVDVPGDWVRLRNANDWVVYRPVQDGVVVAMAGEKSCSVVEKRLYAGLIDLGMDTNVWDTTRADIRLNGLRATVAEGRTKAQNANIIKYVFAHAPENRGCLVAMYSVCDTSTAEQLLSADRVVTSIREP